VGDNVVTGGHVLVTDHVEVCDNVQIAGWSGVNNDIKVPGAYGGHPLQPLRDYMKTTMCLPHLPQFRKVLRELETKVLGKKSSRNEEET
jgi:UDP-3-O-[3-hydroxymyristoyl] glucosamine N-acyltransferase